MVKMFSLWEILHFTINSFYTLWLNKDILSRQKETTCLVAVSSVTQDTNLAEHFGYGIAPKNRWFKKSSYSSFWQERIEPGIPLSWFKAESFLYFMKSQMEDETKWRIFIEGFLLFYSYDLFEEGRAMYWLAKNSSNISLIAFTQRTGEGVIIALKQGQSEIMLKDSSYKWLTIDKKKYA